MIDEIILYDAIIIKFYKCKHHSVANDNCCWKTSRDYSRWIIINHSLTLYILLLIYQSITDLKGVKPIKIIILFEADKIY